MADGSIVIDTELNTAAFKKGVSSLSKVATAGLAAATGAIASFMAYAAKVGSDFEAAMSKVQAISMATAGDMFLLEEKAKQMGATTKFSATEAAEAMQYMAMAGWKAEDMLGGIEGIMNLAAASGEELALTSDIVTDALTAMGYQAKDAGQMADVLAAASSNSNTNVAMMGETFKYVGTMVGSMGYSMEDAALATGLMANAGIKGSMAGTALAGIISRLSTDTNGARSAIEGLGIEFYNTDGSARPLKQVFDELRAATADMTVAQKAELASTVAGEEAKKGLLSILNATTDDYNKLSEAINNSSGAAEEMAAIMQDNLQGQIVLFKSALEGVGIAIYDEIQAPLKNVVTYGSEAMAKLNDAVLNGGMSGFVTTLGDIIADMAVEIAANAPMVLDAAIQVISSFLDGLAANAEQIGGAGGDIIKTLIDGALKLLPKLIDTGIKLLAGLVKGLGNAMPEIITAATEAITVLVEALVGNLDLVLEAAGKIMIALASGLIKAIPQLIQKVPDIIYAIYKALDDACYVLVDIGREIVQGIWQGITDTKDWLKDNVTGFFGNLVSWAKEKLGIHSPSKVFRDEVGQMIGLGINEGLESTEQLLIDTVKTIGERLVDAGALTQDKLAALEEQKAKDRYEKMRSYNIAEIDDSYRAYMEAEQARLTEKQTRLEEVELALQKNKHSKKLQAEQEALQEEISLLEQFQANYSAAYEEMVSAYEQAYDTIMNKQESLEAKLAAFGQLYEKVLDAEGKDTGKIKLADLQSDIDTITQYGNSLEALKQKGAVTQEFLDEILAMSVDDGLKYMQLLLSQTDADFEAYLTLWKEKQKKSKEIAQRYYKDQFDTLKRDFNDKIDKQMGLLPDKAKTIGLNASKNLADGLKANSGLVFGAIDDFIGKFNDLEAAANAARAAANEAANAQGSYAAMTSYSVTDNSRSLTQNVNFSSPAPPSPAESYRAIKQAGRELAY